MNPGTDFTQPFLPSPYSLCYIGDNAPCACAASIVRGHCAASFLDGCEVFLPFLPYRKIFFTGEASKNEPQWALELVPPIRRES